MRSRPLGIHPAWVVAAAAFVALIGAAAFRAAPSVLIVPLEEEFGWSRSLLSVSVSVNLLLFGLTAPFAAALMDRFGIRRVTTSALLLVALGSGLTVFMQSGWHLILLWGVLVGFGTGSMALVFAATVADRWFASRRGLVMGVLTAANATGQLAFLPLTAWVATTWGWRTASLVIAGAAVGVVPIVLRYLRERPSDLGVDRYGEEMPTGAERGEPSSDAGAGVRAVRALAAAARTRPFWALAAGFAICGATTNGLIGVHFVPSAHDHGMAETTAASLLAVVGIFDIAGTIVSGVLTDRVNPRYLLAGYYGFRGLGLVVLPALLGPTVEPSMVVFIVLYGLDWVATVPPTVALCRELFGLSGTIVFGWVFASHQVGAATAALAAGMIRDRTGTYTLAWLGAGGLCVVAAIISASIRRRPVGPEAVVPGEPVVVAEEM